jgi:putative ABC transport system permease protein
MDKGDQMKVLSTLNKMLIRDIWKTKQQFLAAAAVIFAGITLFSATFMSYASLKDSLDEYYKEYSFMDYYAIANNITSDDEKEVKDIKGVKNAISRFSIDIGADMGNDKRVALRLISVPDSKGPEINKLYFISGSYFNSKRECFLSHKFAESYGLKTGNEIKTIINQKDYTFKLAGIATTPEFVYTMKSPMALFTTPEDFGIIYVSESDIKEIFGDKQPNNQLLVNFSSDANKTEVIKEIEKKLVNSGFVSGVERKDQLSHSLLNSFIIQLQNIALVFPLIFLFVAAIMIYILLKRIINNQRSLIGVMKASGYSRARIMGYYSLFSLLIALVGAIPGVAVGLGVGAFMTTMYTNILSLPVITVSINWGILFLAVSICILLCLFSAFNSARKLTKIVPAQALRVEMPSMGKRVLLERVTFIWKRLSFGWKMSFRNIFRSRQRTFLTLIGVIFSVILFMVTLFFTDSIDYIINRHFFEFQKQDFKVTFSQPADIKTVNGDLKKVVGVKDVEPIIEIPTELTFKSEKRNSTIIALNPDYKLYNLVDMEKKPVKVPDKGILLADETANKLGVEVGDLVSVKPYYGADKEGILKVEGIVKEYLGFNCYISLEQANDIFMMKNSATTALITADKEKLSSVKKDLYNNNQISNVEVRLDSFKLFQDILKFMNLFILLMTIFGFVMGFAVIFNTTVINIAERNRELASLKVLGYSFKEIKNTVLRENLFLGFIALIPGIILGRIICGFMVQMFSMDLFKLEVVIYNRTLLIIFASVIMLIIISLWTNRKSLAGLDMVEVLKNREG